MASFNPKIHTTNYPNTFIEIAEDCPANVGEIPPAKGEEKSVANIHFDMIRANPYKYTSDEVVFQVFALKKDLTVGEMDIERTAFFSKGQPCLRASPLGKRYGWGIHHDSEGKVAIFGADSEEYQRFLLDKTLAKTKAMRSKRL